MKDLCSFRQVDEKHLLTEINLMEWSPKMDLIVVSTLAGEVILYRLSWQKVWTIPIIQDHTVTNLIWHPDGKMIAIAYTNFHVYLCNIEDSKFYYDINALYPITTLSWMGLPTPNKKDEILEVIKPHDFMNALDDLMNNMNFLEDSFEDVLPELNMKMDNGKNFGIDIRHLKDQNEFNILLIGIENKILLYAFGLILLGDIPLNQKAISISISHDLCLLSVMCRKNNHDSVIIIKSTSDENEETIISFNLINFDTSFLKIYKSELKMISLKVAHLLSILEYLQSILKSMSEIVEEIRLEMESKLVKFVKEKSKSSNGSIRLDFFQLLLFGNASPELKHFLQNNLTNQNLSILGSTIQKAYSCIQKLLVENVKRATQCIICQLNDLIGMSQWKDRFESLCLNHTILNQAITAAELLMVKSCEMIQVIEGSVKMFLAFYQWLFPIKQRFSNLTTHPVMARKTQDEINLIAQFLNEHFSNDLSKELQGFIQIEKVGQYLKNSCLTSLPDNSKNPWLKFLEENPSMKKAGLLYSLESKESSLIQITNLLGDKIKEFLTDFSEKTQLKITFRNSVELKFNLKNNPELSTPITSIKQNLKIKCISFNKTKLDLKYNLFGLLINTPLESSLTILYQESISKLKSLKLICLGFNKKTSSISNIIPDRSCQILENLDSCSQIVDACFYDDSTISVLIQDNPQFQRVILGQLHFDLISESLHKIAIDSQNIQITQYPITEPECYKVLENIKASRLAVSGLRKVACVLFASKRRVRLFMADGEDENDTTNNCTFDLENQDEEPTFDSPNLV